MEARTHLSGTGQGDIETSPISQKPNVSSRVAPDHTADNHILLPAFKPVDRLYFNFGQLLESLWAEYIKERLLSILGHQKVITDESHLGSVRCDDANLRARQVLIYSQLC